MGQSALDKRLAQLSVGVSVCMCMAFDRYKATVRVYGYVHSLLSLSLLSSDSVATCVRVKMARDLRELKKK